MWGSYALHTCRLTGYSCIFTARMSSTRNESSALQHFDRGNTVEINNGIMFHFYPGLPHMYIYRHQSVVHVHVHVGINLVPRPRGRREMAWVQGQYELCTVITMQTKLGPTFITQMASYASVLMKLSNYALKITPTCIMLLLASGLRRMPHMASTCTCSSSNQPEF